MTVVAMTTTAIETAVVAATTKMAVAVMAMVGAMATAMAIAIVMMVMAMTMGRGSGQLLVRGNLRDVDMEVCEEPTVCGAQGSTRL
jgi:hypothetical protein